MIDYQTGGPVDPIHLDSEMGCTFRIAAEWLERIAVKAIQRGVELEREVERLEIDARLRDEQLAAADRVIGRLKGQKPKTFHRHRCSAPTLDGGQCRRPVLAYGVKCWRHV